MHSQSGGDSGQSPSRGTDLIRGRYMRGEHLPLVVCSPMRHPMMLPPPCLSPMPSHECAVPMLSAHTCGACTLRRCLPLPPHHPSPPLMQCSTHVLGTLTGDAHTLRGRPSPYSPPPSPAPPLLLCSTHVISTLTGFVLISQLLYHLYEGGEGGRGGNSGRYIYTLGPSTLPTSRASANSSRHSLSPASTPFPHCIPHFLPLVHQQTPPGTAAPPRRGTACSACTARGTPGAPAVQCRKGGEGYGMGYAVECRSEGMGGGGGTSISAAAE